VPVDVVGAAVAWTGVVPVVVVPVVDGSVVVVLPVAVAESNAAVVTAVEEPSWERAAMIPKPPTAAALAIVVPIVIARRRAIARSRSMGLRRVAVFMATGSARVPFRTVTAFDRTPQGSYPGRPSVGIESTGPRTSTPLAGGGPPGRGPSRVLSHDRQRPVTSATSAAAIVLPDAPTPRSAEPTEEHPGCID
jgi:hypothetical protein